MCKEKKEILYFIYKKTNKLFFSKKFHKINRMDEVQFFLIYSYTRDMPFMVVAHDIIFKTLLY